MKAINKVIKDRSRINEAYATRLGKFITHYPKIFFADSNKADSWADFETWPDKKTDRRHLIIKGEVCVIDRMWEGRHAYVISQFYGNGKKVKDLYLVCYVDDLKRTDWRNGYYLIPDLDNVLLTL
jgi:hypothetical protein